MSYLLGLPNAAMVSVTVVPAPPDVVSAVNATLATAVEFIMLNMHSFTSSTALVIDVLDCQVLNMPVGHNAPSLGVPSVKLAALVSTVAQLKFPLPSVCKYCPDVPPVMLTLALLPKDITPVLELKELPSTTIFAIFTLPELSSA